MENVLFYTKVNCSLCDDAMGMLYMLQYEYDFTIEERDIYTNDDWLQAYRLLIPVVEVAGRQVDCESMSYGQLDQLLRETISEQ